MYNKNGSFERIINLVKTLPKERMQGVIDEIYSKLVLELNSVDNSVYGLNSESISYCKKCGSQNIVKNGKDRHGHTRYLCKKCRATFGELTGSAVFGSHKDASVWKKYISLLLDSASLSKCAKECSMSKQTAFIWRHKILNTLTRKSFSPFFNGLIEMDEMYVRISYKGNHKKSKGFTMPRKPFKRGSDNRIPGNNSKASVLCVVERDRSFSAMVSCRGIINLPLLTKIFDERIADESIILTDGLRAYNQYFQNLRAEHVVLQSHGGKPTVNGPYHINNVNALQHRFRRFLADYNGVSTKYLNNYLALFLWMENNKHCNREKLLLEELNSPGAYVSAKKLAAAPPVPELAPAA